MILKQHGWSDKLDEQVLKRSETAFEIKTKASQVTN